MQMFYGIFENQRHISVTDIFSVKISGDFQHYSSLNLEMLLMDPNMNV